MNRLKFMTRNSGFTLIEIVIYLALFSLVVGGLLVTTYGIIEGSGRIQSKASVNEDALFISRKLDWALNGSAVSVPSPDLIQITKLIPGFPPAENPLVLALTSGSLTLKRGGGSAVPLNNANVTVSNLNFVYDSAEKVLQTNFTLTNLAETQSFAMTNHLRQ